MQNELPIISPVKSPERVPAHLISLCQSSSDAVLLAMRYGKKTMRQTADAIGMEPAQLSRIVSGGAHMPADLSVKFAHYVGNLGWQQWVAFACGLDLVRRQESTEEKLLRIESENAELRARMSA